MQYRMLFLNTMNMKKMVMKTLMLGLSLFVSVSAFSQVSGLSYTLSPYGEYNWFGNNSGIQNGYFAGGQFGIGFGQNVELRGLYARGLGLKTQALKFGVDVTENQIDLYKAKDLNFVKYGGEIKLNLSRSKFLPYLTVGTGIQSIGTDTTNTSKQIYLNAGLGVQFTAGDRYTIGLQAVNHRYRYNAIRSLLDDNDREVLGIDNIPAENDVVSNWALKASLIFYLGGRKPGERSDIDKAYWDNFSGGFRGLNVPIEVQASRMNFNENLPYKNAWMAGGSAGLNFGPLVGVRGFYWRAMETGSLTKFDDLAMYGGEGRFKLNEGKGFTPWITVGGGMIDVNKDYVGRDSTVQARDRGFASAGVGVDLPFSKYFKATGFARSILTTGDNDKLNVSPDDIYASWNYGVSFNFVIGKQRKKMDVIKKSEYDSYIIQNQAANEAATAELRAKYEGQIMNLENDLAEAIERQDFASAQEIQREKNEAEEIVNEIERYSRYDAPMHSGVSPSQIRMTPAEFQLLLRDLNDNRRAAAPYAQAQVAPSAQNMLNNELDKFKKEQAIESLKESVNELQDQLKEFTNQQRQQKSMEDARLNDRLKSISTQLTEINTQIRQNETKLASLAAQQTALEKGIESGENFKMVPFEATALQSDINRTNERINELRSMMIEMMESDYELGNYKGWERDPMNRVQRPSNQSMVKGREDAATEGFFSNFQYKGMSAFTGINVGGPTTFNLGYRVYYRLGKEDSKFDFVPESFFGLGSPSTFGLSGNVLYNIDFLTNNPMVQPYIGLGAGMMKVGTADDQDKLTGTWNFMVGTTFNVWSGDLFADFTARNAFKYNQIIVGYRFPF